jgi:hypothetical protein
MSEVIVEPVTEPVIEPIVETVAEPAVEPVIVEPVIEEPVVEEPVVEEPVVVEPVVEEPVVEEPVVEEPVVEEPVVAEESAVKPVVENLVNEIIVNTLIELVKKSLENEDAKNKLYIALTPEVISVIKNIVSLAPNTLTDIEKAMLEVIKDGNIDSKDIPNLIIIVQKLYQVVYSLKNVGNKRAVISGSILKYIINLLVVERIIKIDEEKQPEFFIQVNALIDSCVGLLSFPDSIKTKGCLKKMFG